LTVLTWNYTVVLCLCSVHWCLLIRWCDTSASRKRKRKKKAYDK